MKVLATSPHLYYDRTIEFTKNPIEIGPADQLFDIPCNKNMKVTDKHTKKSKAETKQPDVIMKGKRKMGK